MPFMPVQIFIQAAKSEEDFLYLSQKFKLNAILLEGNYAKPIPVSLQKIIAAPHTISPMIKSNTISPTAD